MSRPDADPLRPESEVAGNALSLDRRRVAITGVTGTLGDALARAYLARGFEVVGVTHRANVESHSCHRVVRCAQATATDAEQLLDLDPDVLILNAGRIETAIGPAGTPLAGETAEIFTLNAIFPALVIAAVGSRGTRRQLDLVAVGSIADGSPSCFGPAYHASKTALHSFIAGAGPIVNAAHPLIRVRRREEHCGRGAVETRPRHRSSPSASPTGSRAMPGSGAIPRRSRSAPCNFFTPPHPISTTGCSGSAGVEAAASKR